jgi:hypothetical protein
MSTKELQEKLVEKMKTWQKIEDSAVASTSQIIKESENPLISMVMEIIKADSQMHHRVQEFIVGMYEKQAVALTPEEMGSVWDAIEKHIAIEKKMVAYVEEALESLKGKKMLVPEYLLTYLRADEQKHDDLLAGLEYIKRGMYPYSS